MAHAAGSAFDTLPPQALHDSMTSMGLILLPPLNTPYRIAPCMDLVYSALLGRYLSSDLSITALRFFSRLLIEILKLKRAVLRLHQYLDLLLRRLEFLAAEP